MTHNKKVYDLFYFKGIIDDYNIELKSINEFDEQMKTTKNIPFNKNQVIVNKDTFDTMNKIVKESKKL